jgi:hypothetical protein
MNVVCFLLENSLAFEFYMPTFRNTLFHLHGQVGMKMEQTECSKTLAHKIQTEGNYAEENIQQILFHFCHSINTYSNWLGEQFCYLSSHTHCTYLQITK